MVTGIWTWKYLLGGDPWTHNNTYGKEGGKEYYTLITSNSENKNIKPVEPASKHSPEHRQADCINKRVRKDIYIDTIQVNSLGGR
jgi:hypothetical protein